MTYNMFVKQNLYVFIAFALIVSHVYCARYAEVINPLGKNVFTYGGIEENSVLLHT